MFNLLLFDETFSNQYISNVLVFIDVVSIIAAILVIISKNPIVSVLFLIGLFLGISCHLLVAGLNFIALSYLLVYVGAVSILFLFILMLINIRISELSSETSNVVPLALILGLSFNICLHDIFISDDNHNVILDYRNISIIHEFLNKVSNKNIFFISSKLWDGSLAETTHISSIGDVLYTNYSIWLILTSIILLLAMVGAIVITIKQPQ